MSEHESKISDIDLLARWQEQELDAELNAEFDTRRATDANFANMVESIQMVNAKVSLADSVKPPVWDKSATMAFATHAQPRNASWLSLGAMAMSVLAMLMVVSGFQIQSQNGSVMMGFNLSPDTQQVTALVDAKIAEYQQIQQAINAEYISALQMQTTQSNNELTQYLLKTSRVERRQDFVELIKFINEQRDDDQRFYARQLNKLESDIYSHSIKESP